MVKRKSKKSKTISVSTFSFWGDTIPGLTFESEARAQVHQSHTEMIFWNIQKYTELQWTRLTRLKCWNGKFHKRSSHSLCLGLWLCQKTFASEISWPPGLMRNTRNSLRFQTWCFFALSIPGRWKINPAHMTLLQPASLNPSPLCWMRNPLVSRVPGLEPWIISC